MSNRNSIRSGSDRRQSDRAQIAENRKKILTNGSTFAIREAYVQLRTNLMYSVASMDDRGCKVFGVTSPNPSEGKSLTASNIAISFAMLGKKTLLMDCDMRKPNIARLWRIHTKNGMSDLIAKVDSCDVYGVDGLPLSIIACGKIPPNPSEMLASAAFQNAVEYFRKKYDYIIIDTPPINEVADAQIVSRLVDGMLLVVRSGHSKQRDLAEAESALQSAGSRICGVVINDLNLKQGGKYGYKYEYKRDYRYGSAPDSSFGTGTSATRKTTKKKTPEIDFHAHILPGLDHGSGDVQNSLQQIKLAKESGVDVICATSHFYGQQTDVDAFLEKRARCWLDLKANLPEGSPRIILGAEVLAFEGIESLPHLADLCLMGTDLLLLEMPFTGWSDRLKDSVEALSERGDLTVVLAHVDRYDRSQIESLLALDRVYGQVNVSALTRHVQSAYLRNWMREGKIVALGSDLHGTKTGYTEWQSVKDHYPEEWKTVMQATEALIPGLF